MSTKHPYWIPEEDHPTPPEPKAVIVPAAGQGEIAPIPILSCCVCGKDIQFGDFRWIHGTEYMCKSCGFAGMKRAAQLARAHVCDWKPIDGTGLDQCSLCRAVSYRL